jgi:uncharacterized protein
MTTPPPPNPPQNPPTSSGDDKTMALICHFGMVIFGAIPALIIYFVKADSPYVRNEAKKAFNFSIITTVLIFIVNIISIFGGFSVTSVEGAGVALIVGCFICLVIAVAVITQITFGVINGIKANDGKETKYPFGLPILK